MSLALLVVVAAVVLFFVIRKRRKTPAVARESTPALDAWIAEALELELAEGALDLAHSTPEERRRLVATLRGVSRERGTS